MSNPRPTHPILLLLNAFLAQLGDRFDRYGPGILWTPDRVAIALLLIAVRHAGGGVQITMRQLSAGRPDLFGCEPTDSAFAKARRKLSLARLEAGWIGLMDEFIRLLGDVLPRVDGYRLLAIDGTWVNTPRSRPLWRHCRRHRRGRPPKDPKGQPQVLIVVLVDVLTRMPVAWCEVEPGRGERSAVAKLLRHVDRRTILLADRGFPSREILDGLLQTGCRFVMRMTTGASAFQEVTRVLAGTRRDRNVTFRLGQGRNQTDWTGRLITGRPLDQTEGELWCLLANLPRNHRWTRSAILDLYHHRWGIETFFKELKALLGIGRFHALDIDGIRQEIVMAMVAATLVAAMELIALTVALCRKPRWNDPRMARCVRSVLTQTVESLLTMDPTVRDVALWLDEALRMSGLRARKRRPGRRYPRICKSFYGKWKHRFKKGA